MRFVFSFRHHLVIVKSYFLRVRLCTGYQRIKGYQHLTVREISLVCLPLLRVHSPHKSSLERIVFPEGSFDLEADA